MFHKKRWKKKRLKQIREWEQTHGRIQHFEFNTVGIIGATGSGKTLCLTWIGKNFATHPTGAIQVYGNMMRCKVPHYVYVADPFELLRMEGIVLVDEISKYANARLSSDARTMFYSELTSEARKVTSSLYYTDQRFKGNVDPKIRNNTDYVLFPTYYKELHWCVVYAFEGTDFNQPIDVFQFDCLPIYDLFDTREKIRSIYRTPKRSYAELLREQSDSSEVDKNG